MLVYGNRVKTGLKTGVSRFIRGRSKDLSTDSVNGDKYSDMFGLESGKEEGVFHLLVHIVHLKTGNFPKRDK